MKKKMKKKERLLGFEPETSRLAICSQELWHESPRFFLKTKSKLKILAH